MLKGLAGVKPELPQEDVEGRIRAEVVGSITKGLMQLAGGDASEMTDFVLGEAPSDEIETVMADDNGYMSPWLDTDECTSCDECIELNAKIFAYNSDKKAYIQDAKAGPYEDLVKAAEKCTAQVIHPGLPADRSAKDIDKWIARGEKFNS
jgi:pyruvate-ferredoxin/flavodoxin oxidoreductase